MIFTIARHDLLRLFRSPLGWTLLAIALFIQAWIFYRLVQSYQQSPVISGINAGVTYSVAARFLGSTAYIGMLIIPLLCMRSLSAEFHSGTIRLLFLSPARSWQIMLGKYLGIMGFIVIMLLLLCMLPLTLAAHTSLDSGMLLSSLLATVLLLSGFAAISLFISSLTRHQAIAAFAAIGVLLLLVLLELLAGTGIAAIDNMLAWLASFKHFEPMLYGLLDTRDIAYFIIVTLLFSGLTALRLNYIRQRVLH